uniref:Uncharacterized protein n=1 Tax=Castor canadensis TaxID=51338 RepID=A0A8C0ZM45_CASCN
MDTMAKPDCVITCDGNRVTMQTKSTLKTTGFFVPWERSLKKLQLWKTQTVCNFTDKALAQYEERSGKKGIPTRKLKDGKLVVECSVSNVAILMEATRRPWMDKRYGVLLKGKTIPTPATWMDIETILLREISQQNNTV